jgi:hypothetical protein
MAKNKAKRIVRKGTDSPLIAYSFLQKFSGDKTKAEIINSLNNLTDKQLGDLLRGGAETLGSPTSPTRKKKIKTPHTGSMKGASRSARVVRGGQISGKEAWARARSVAGEDAWKNLSKTEKVKIALEFIGDLRGRDAIGAIREIGSRALPLGGSNDGLLAELETWGKARGVKDPKAEAVSALRIKQEGGTSRDVAKRQVRGAEDVAPVSKTDRKAERARIRKAERNAQMDEIIARATEQDQAKRELVQARNKRVGGQALSKTEDAKFRKLPKGTTKFISVTWMKPVVSDKKDPLTDQFKIENHAVEVTVPFDARRKKYVLWDPVTTSWKYVSPPDIREALALQDKQALRERTARKPKTSPERGLFKDKMTELTRAGGAINNEFTLAAARNAYLAAQEKITIKNRNALAAGTPKEKLTPRWTLNEFMDSAFPDIAASERRAMANKIRSEFRGARATRRSGGDTSGEKPRVVKLKNETVAEGRLKATAKERRQAAGRAAPLEKPTVETKKEKASRIKREKSALSLMESTVSTKYVSPESVSGGPSKAKRIPRVAKVPTTDIERNIAALRETMDPKEKRKFYEIGQLSKSGFPKARVSAAVKKGVFGEISPKVKAAAKAAGYMNIALLALNFLDGERKKKIK